MKFRVGDEVTVKETGFRTVVRKLYLNDGIEVDGQGSQRVNWFYAAELRFTKDGMERLVKTRMKRKCKNNKE